jgi:hypothetical protein
MQNSDLRFTSALFDACFPHENQSLALRQPAINE